MARIPSFPLAALAGLSLLAFSLTTMPTDAQAKTPRFSFKVVKAFPHDPTAFTQGLVFADGIFYESTGLRGYSTLRKVAPETGAVLQQATVESRYFAEGLALVGNELLQLTWQEHTGFVHDKTTLKRLRTFTYPTEGWGLAFDGRSLVMSDGSARLFFLDPRTQKPVRDLQVMDGARPVEGLRRNSNGHCCDNYHIIVSFRNAYIDSANGRVTGWIDLTGLLRQEARGPQGDVLNGIAWDKAGDRIFVTGKKWPLLFQIETVPVS